MIETDPIVRIANFQREHLDARNVDLHWFGSVPCLHDAAVPKLLAIAKNEKLHTGFRAIDLAIDTNARGELRPAFDGNCQAAVGMGAKAVLEMFAADGQRMSFNRGIPMRIAPILRSLGNVQLVEADRFGRNQCAGQSQKTDGDARTPGRFKNPLIL